MKDRLRRGMFHEYVYQRMDESISNLFNYNVSFLITKKNKTHTLDKLPWDVISNTCSSNCVFLNIVFPFPY